MRRTAAGKVPAGRLATPTSDVRARRYLTSKEAAQLPPGYIRECIHADNGAHPDPLLRSVDRRAKALGISRNRLVVRALEQAVRVRSEWAPEFLERLRRVDPGTSAAAGELLNAVKRARRSKEPHVL